jgi:phosphohistidine swiveling domain-containing protein
MAESLTIDTSPHPVFPVYSAGNYAEVAPERLSVMSWSLVGDPTERALRSLVDRVWPEATWHTGSHYVFVGYFACRPYHNLSALCQLAAELPGLRSEDVTASYFQDQEPPAVALARAGLGGRSAAVPRLARELLSLRRRLTLIEGRLAEVEHAAGRALESGGQFELGRVFERARAILDDAWSVHYVATAGLPPIRALQRALGERLVPWWDEAEPWLNRPDQLVWPALRDAVRSGDPVPAARFLSFPLYEVASELPPWSGFAREEILGAGEGGAARRAAIEPADAIWGMLRGPRAGMLRRLARAVEDTMSAREASKSLAMRGLHVFRLILPAVADAAGLDRSAWPYLTVDELGDPPPGASLGELAERRREECALALAEPMPEAIDFSGGADGWSAVAEPADARRGRGVSPGAVTGVVVGGDLRDLDGDRPRVLVCEAVDADVEPVLPLVDGLVTAKGSLLSHVSIIAREHGIPAVVGYAPALELRPGQVVSVDGTSGEVHVVAS